MLHAYQVITKMILLGLSKMLTLTVLNLGNYESYDEIKLRMYNLHFNLEFNARQLKN